MEYYEEDLFYKDNGFPVEKFKYCNFIIHVDSLYPNDYDQFALVTNAECPYLRLTKKRGLYHFPCGGSESPSVDGNYANLTDFERNVEYPKIAHGFVAIFLARLSYDNIQQDYILPILDVDLFQDYYQTCFNHYKRAHSGLRFSYLSLRQLELNFIESHLHDEKVLLERCSPLIKYPILYGYANEMGNRYESYILSKRKEYMHSDNGFSTEIREVYGNKYVKVYFSDDSDAKRMQSVVASLDCVKKVNVSRSESKAHPGDTLTVYPKPMYTAKNCELAVIDVLRMRLSNTSIGSMKPNSEAKFEEIESRILLELDNAKAIIYVCVAWFTNEHLKNKLLERASNGVDVRVIIYDDGVNSKNGVDLTGIPHRLLRGAHGGIMHRKFCVIDNVTIISGSYNWTKNAEHKNDEEISINKEDYKLASEYTLEFNRMWKRNDEL